MKIIFCGRLTGANNGPIEHIMGFVVGLERLGHEVYLVEEVKKCVDSKGNRVNFEAWDGRRRFEWRARSYRIWPRCCLLYKRGQATHGMFFPDVIKLTKNCNLLIVQHSHATLAEIGESVPCKAFIDANPGKTQVRIATRNNSYKWTKYDYYFTFGLKIGTSACPIPTGGATWHKILQPIILSAWPYTIDQQCDNFTTLSSWAERGSYSWQGIASGGKTDNWRKFIHLPEHTDQKLEITLDVDELAEEDAELLRQRRWLISDSKRLRNTEDYKNYVASSRAEFTVTHNPYVEFKTGFMGDCSPSYLASGKPVLMQSTGFENQLPTGKGLLTFTTMEEAIEGIDAINKDYLAHCRAARAIAEEYFDSDKVLSRMLREMGF